MIDPLAPVLPAAPTPTPAPRYLTVPGPNGVLRILRPDGLPIGYRPPPDPPEPKPTPAPSTEAPVMPLFTPDYLEALRRRQEAQRRADLRRPRQPAPPPDPDAPAFTPDEIKTARENELNLSQRDLAAAIGTNRGQLAGAEAGTRHLSPYAARRLAQLLAEKRARKGA